MKRLAGRIFLCVVLCVLTIQAGPAAQIGDVPRSTQMGNPPAPEGAPGNGRYFPPVPAKADLPTLWIIGDSTVRNGTLGDGSNMDQWGWGAPIVTYFDLNKINVVNRAFGGTSSRSFYTGFFWQNLRPQIKKGDFVLMQFGANDNGGATGVGALAGVGEDTQSFERAGKTEIVHTFGWYLRQFVKETRERGAMPIICSLTPRKAWTSDGHFRRDNTTHAAWAAAVAKETGTPFVDLYELIASEYETLGPEKVDSLYVPAPMERLHTGWDGAVINAQLVIAGLKQLKPNPLEGTLAGLQPSNALARNVPGVSSSKDGIDLWDEPWVFEKRGSQTVPRASLDSARTHDGRAGPIPIRLETGSTGKVSVVAGPCGPSDLCTGVRDDCGCFVDDSFWITITDARGRLFKRLHFWAAYGRFQIVPVDILAGQGDELMIFRIPGRGTPPKGYDIKIWRIDQAAPRDLATSEQVAGHVFPGRMAVPCVFWKTKFTIDPATSKPRSFTLHNGIRASADCLPQETSSVAVDTLQPRGQLRFDRDSGKYVFPPFNARLSN